MKIKSTIIALLIGLSLISVACSKSAANMSGSNKSAPNLSDDDHKLYEAAEGTDDMKLIKQVNTALGLTDLDYPAFEKFIEEHEKWRMKNADWVKEYSTNPQKAGEYVKTHMP